MTRAIEKKRILRAIYGALDDINRRLPAEQQVEKKPEAALFGPKGRLDSLGLVTLMAAVEEKVEEEFAAVITLASENAVSKNNNPFETVTSLTDYIASLLGGHI